MRTHHLSVLQGPATADRAWWPRTAEELIVEARPSPTNPEPCTEDAVPRLSDSDIRAELVLRVRREIAAGIYDTPEKWGLAFDRLIEDEC